MSISSNLKENRLIATAEEVVVHRLKDATEQRFRWSDVSRVVAYKIDLFSFDQVRISFYTESGKPFDVSEDDDGFRSVMTAAETVLARFPNLDAWKPSVVAEPFARSKTVLWPPPSKQEAEQVGASNGG
ncbi:hypothetical protein FEM03_00245 [Phragmitibacter flavus]|uniref:Uncharacterized protein n=1 Tax=Phragmitibacter flavus TaxID=2576071 RepID=A0A5R8KJP3_9BACT|nr:hypothetical protein [Phragmitibacter flavus]TLD72543.1 hypothetical protein FEM03_00245 [Phragmitibacter flavus]